MEDHGEPILAHVEERLSFRDEANGDAVEESASSAHAVDPVVTLVSETRKDLPECSFGALTFDLRTRAVIQSVFSENVTNEMARFVEDNFTIPEFFTVSKLTFDGVWVDISGSILAKAGKMDVAVAALSQIGADVGLLLLSWRDKSFGAFKAPDLDVISNLLGELRSYFELCRVHEEDLQNNLQQVLSQLGIGLLVVDDSMRIVRSSSLAEKILSEGRSLVRAEGHLRITDAAARSRIERNIAFLRKDSSSGVEALIVPLPGVAGGEPMRVSLTRLASNPFLGAPRIALTLSRTERHAEISATQLRGIGLTNAEANLAAALLKGMTVIQYAQSKGLAVPTVRAHLKRIMMRLNVHRQSDLVRTLMSMF